MPVDEDWIWVFGSNLAGRHGKGAALVARESFGAKQGEHNGMTGWSYAIPTKNVHLQPLPLDVVVFHIGFFIGFAELRPHFRFFVTRVGCGLAGFKDSEIAPFFAHAPVNCSLPEPWARYIPDQTK